MVLKTFKYLYKQDKEKNFFLFVIVKVTFLVRSSLRANYLSLKVLMAGFGNWCDFLIIDKEKSCLIKSAHNIVVIDFYKLAKQTFFMQEVMPRRSNYFSN